MMRWVYAAVIAAIFGCIAWTPTNVQLPPLDIAATIAGEAAIPNAVTGILLRNRLYDTIFEVFVFTIAVLGVQHYLSHHEAKEEIVHISDDTTVIVARIGAMVAALVALELSLRGHLAPGGAFAAGVAGGTAIGLVAITTEASVLVEHYVKWHIGGWEKATVLVFLLLAILSLSGLRMLAQPVWVPLDNVFIPLLNVLIALKVTFGAWTIVLTFIRYRGLL